LLAAVYSDIGRSAVRSLQSNAVPLRHTEYRSFTPGQVSPVIYPQSNGPSQSLVSWLRPTLNCNTSRIYVSHSDLYVCGPCRAKLFI